MSAKPTKSPSRWKTWVGLLGVVILLVGLFQTPLWRLYYRVDYVPLIVSAARDQGLDPHTLAAIIFVESRFRPGAKSEVGAEGLMQLMPETAAEVSQRHGLPKLGSKGLLEPEMNIEIGARYYRELKTRFGTHEKALAAYNAGPTLVDEWSDGEIPYPETRHFVHQVLHHKSRLEQLYPGWDSLNSEGLNRDSELE